MHPRVTPRALLIAALVAVAILGSGPAPSADAAPAAACVTFPETSKVVCDRFLDYWQTHGGLAQQGLPLTNAFIEVNPTDGKPYLTQYFERARFEAHPENAPPYDVLLGLLGREQLQAKYPNGTPTGLTGSPIGATCAAFPATGKQVCGVFLEYWNANGGLAQQGLPLTDLFLETNPHRRQTVSDPILRACAVRVPRGERRHALRGPAGPPGSRAVAGEVPQWRAERPGAQHAPGAEPLAERDAEAQPVAPCAQPLLWWPRSQSACCYVARACA